MARSASARLAVSGGNPIKHRGTVAVVGKISMNAHPAVGTGVQARELVPDVRRAAIDAEPARALQRGMGHVHSHVLPGLPPSVAQLTSRKRGSSDGRLGGSTHRKG